MRKFPYADIKNAIEIRDSIVGPINVSRGKGTVNDSFYESNSAWFKLNIDQDTLLTFDLVPKDSLDDYDFLIFKCSNDTCFNQIKRKQEVCPRMCQSYCTSRSGITGLSRYAGQTHVNPGPGPAFASALPVKAGETYYLLVDFPDMYIQTQNRRPLGFSIYFYNYWPKRRAPVVLQTIYFKSNEAGLQKEAFAELDKLAAQLKKNHMVIEVSGHTDNQGNADENQQLSEARAQVVVNYLVSKNIAAKRLFSKGYGSSRPLALNTNDEGRKKNRRVEFLVLLN
jgi:outer membrane protein OmpA-like peptidoglycan-associated protein